MNDYTTSNGGAIAAGSAGLGVKVGNAAQLLLCS